MNYINTYCHISNDSLRINGKEVNMITSNSNEELIHELYTSLDLKYSKFHKMDNLSKIGIIGTELLKKENPEIESYGENDIAILFSNPNSSANTDINFQKSYENDGIPSPSLFVYTLPNIVIGELSIKNKWFGENMFTVSPKFDNDFYANYCTILLSKNSEAVICGWINENSNKIEAFFFFVTKKDIKQLNLPLNSETLDKLYKIK